MNTFSFETLRTSGFTNYFGADLGEVLATARQITDGDQGSWHRAWKATAARVAELGEQSLAAGHRITARENLLRASNYYRNAAAFVLDNPADNPEVAALYAAQIDTFAAASALFDHPAEAVSIPYREHHAAGLSVPRRRHRCAPAHHYLHQRLRLDLPGVLLRARRRRAAPRV